MVRVGVVLPWIVGIVLYLVPNWATTRSVAGQCHNFRYWKTRQLYLAYTTTAFALTLVLPMVVFVVCYGSIVAVIRRQGRQISATGVTQSGETVAADITGNKLVSKSQKNVIKTMITVSTSYMLCWFPIKFYVLAVTYRLLAPVGQIFNALTLVSYINMLVNPVVYVSHFNFVRRTGKALARCCPPLCQMIHGRPAEVAVDVVSDMDGSSVEMKTFDSSTGKRGGKSALST